MEKKLLSVLAFVIVSVLTIAFIAGASADSQPDVNWMKVYVKGEQVFEGRCNSTWSTPNATYWNCDIKPQFHTPSIERGENVDVTVVFESGKTVSNALVRVWARSGGSTIEDQTGTFDLFPENTYTRTLYLKMPSNMDGWQFYTMHVEIEADSTVKGITRADITFDIQKLANELSIKSVNLRTSCPTACSTVYADVVVKNTGNHAQNDIYVTAKVKELGVTGTQYINVLVPVRNGDDEQSQEVTIPLQLPLNVQSGTYTVEITASSNEAESTTVTQQFVISGQVSSSIELSTQTSRQDVEQGKTATYTFIVTNRGTSTQVLSLDATGLEGWATTQMNPSTFSLAAGESKLVSVYVTSKEDAIVAEHLFSVKVNYGSETKTLNFVANVTEDETTSLDLKAILMIVGIVLAVAIIVLLIVLLAQKSRSEVEKPEESYY
ncbi:MAG: hypothetical protein NTX24_02085 [Candidatus Pacearchaeota archaeon]|nr:hypothetical protein [Candidatus Pacearchaeota archaeon]